MSLNSYIAEQFKYPTGLSGNLVSFVMNRQNRPLYDDTIKMMPIPDNGSILDIGCGNGYVLDMLASRNNCKFTGLDMSASIIKTALRRNNRHVKTGRMEFICQDICATAFADCSFNIAYSINTIYFWQSLDSTLAEIWRILKPNGSFLNTLYTNETLSRFSHTRHEYKRFEIRQITDAGEKAGFSVKAVPIYNNLAYCVVSSKPG